MLNSNLSKSAKRKLKRHGKSPSLKKRMTRKEFFGSVLNKLSESSEYLWQQGEELAEIYVIKRV